MRSPTGMLSDERQEDFDELAAGWRAEYASEGQATESMLKRVIWGEWLLLRAERRYLEAEADLAEVDPGDWTEEDHKRIELDLRYKTVHERSFYRAFYALRAVRKDKIREELALDKVEARMNKIARNVLQNAASEQEAERNTGPEARSTAPEGAVSRAAEVFGSGEKSDGKKGGKKTREPVVLEQWVEVEIADGRTVTKLYPSNQQLIEEGRKLERVPELIYRKINFPNGVPEEYSWTYARAGDGAAERRERAGMGTQRMTADHWLEVIEREAASGTGHVGPTGVGNLPRPKERGGCECQVCVRNRELLERRVGE